MAGIAGQNKGQPLGLGSLSLPLFFPLHGYHTSVNTTKPTASPGYLMGLKRTGAGAASRLGAIWAGNSVIPGSWFMAGVGEGAPLGGHDPITL